jgi:hypothetical protein
MHSIAALLLAVIASLPASALAHDTTDWRTDAEAFRSARAARLKPRRLAPVLSPERAANYPDLVIDAAHLKQKLSQLAGAVPVTIDGRSVTIPERGGAQGRALALKFLAQEYAALGFTTSAPSFGRGANFVAERRGSDPSRVLILSAHVDSVDNAGANDDGAGVIAGLAIARALQGYDLHYTLRFVGFDLEEIGLVGSKAYVASLKGAPETLIGDIHLEMMATNSRRDGAFHVIDCDKATSTPLSAHVMGAISALRIPLERVDACTDRSDHASFWKAGLPAIVLSENFFGGDGDRCYHEDCDRVDSRLDFDYMARITRAVGSASAVLLGATLH